MNILIVDDQEDARIILKKTLESQGHSVHLCANGREALDALQAGGFGLIISDILMPVMDGFQLCRACKQNESLREIPFVFNTATYTDEKDEAFALDLGANRFIRKPLEPDAFLNVIREVIQEAQEGRMKLPHCIQREEAEIYKLYSERLVQKLAQKMISLEVTLKEKEKAERSAQASENLFGLAFDNANIGMCLVNLDGRLTRVNPEMCRIFGYNRNELEGISVNDITHPKDLDVSPSFIRGAISGGLDHSEFEKRYIHKAGHVLWGKVSSSLVRDHAGAPLYFISHVQDVTRQKEMELALRASEEKYRTLVETAMDAICIFQDGRVKYHTHRVEELLGRTEQEIHGEPFLPFIHPDDRDMVLERHVKRAQGEHVVSAYPFRVVNKAGEVLWVEGNASLVTWEGRSAVLSFLRDITARRELEAQLIQAQKLESVARLAGGVAHDFNNLLSVILGYVEMVLMELTQENPQRESLDEVYNAAVRAKTLTRQLLAFSRTQVLEIRTLDINEVIIGFEKLLRRLLREDIEMEVQLTPQTARVNADIAQLEQVLMNLVVNARDAMPKGGRLLIESGVEELDQTYASTRPGIKPGRYVLVSVSDDGMGMDSKTMDRIFEPFFTTKEEGTGTGLGLSTVYGIVKQHGGNIWVYSEPGHGTTFKIYLPEASKEAESRKEPYRKRLTPTGPVTILVVEDDQSVRKLACRMLRREGYHVLESMSPAHAVDMARKHAGPIHLLLTDVVMPGTTGPEVYQEIYKLHPETRVLYMSGYPRRSLARYGAELETVPLIQKPLMIKPLMEKVAECLMTE